MYTKLTKMLKNDTSSELQEQSINQSMDSCNTKEHQLYIYLQFYTLGLWAYSILPLTHRGNSWHY